MIRTVGIISRPRREDIARVVPPLLEWLHAHGVEVVCDSETGECIGPLTGQTRKREELPAHSDLLIVLGGDGTLLSAARLAAARQVPILAVNLGGMGFLTTVPQDELYQILEEIFSEKHRVSERVLLEARIVRDGAVIRRQIALNDAVFSRGEISRLIRLHTRVNGEALTEFNADGLIIATPTGSTAYSLSAGGPILEPESGVFVITPICPHVLTNRSIIVSENSTIEVEASEPDYPVYLTVDGREPVRITKDATVQIRKAKKTLQLAAMPDMSFFSVVRQKLKWSGSNV